MTDNLIKQLRALAKGYHGRALRAYTEEILKEFGDISEIDPQNFSSRREAIAFIKDKYLNFFDRLRQDISSNEEDFE